MLEFAGGREDGTGLIVGYCVGYAMCCLCGRH